MKRLVIFDFDYTLADSTAGIVDCIQTSQAAMDLPVADREAIRHTVGMSVPDILVALNGEAQRHRADEFGRRFRARADEVMVASTVFYPQTLRVLQALRDAGVCVAIASTKFRYRIEGLLAREGLADGVDLVVGGEDVAAHKPDPACLLAVVKATGIDAGDALYVGDSLADAGAAQAAAIDFVAVLSGTTTAAAFAPFAPRVVLDDVGQLPAWLAQTGRSAADRGADGSQERGGRGDR